MWIKLTHTRKTTFFEQGRGKRCDTAENEHVQQAPDARVTLWHGMGTWRVSSLNGTAVSHQKSQCCLPCKTRNMGKK